MKTKLIIISWLGSLMMMATDNMLQALIAMCMFALSSYLLHRNRAEIQRAVKRFERRIDNLIK